MSKYEILPTLFDPKEAMKEGAILITRGHVGGKEKKPTNVPQSPWRLIAGDVDEARKNSAHVAQDRFKGDLGCSLLHGNEWMLGPV